MNANKKETIVSELKERFGVIINKSNTFLNSRLFVKQNFPVTEEEASECANEYISFLKEKKDEYRQVNWAFVIISGDIKRNTGHDLISNFSHAFRKAGLSYSLPS